MEFTLYIAIGIVIAVIIMLSMLSEDMNYIQESGFWAVGFAAMALWPVALVVELTTAISKFVRSVEMGS